MDERAGGINEVVRGMEIREEEGVTGCGTGRRGRKREGRGEKGRKREGTNRGRLADYVATIPPG